MPLSSARCPLRCTPCWLRCSGCARPRCSSIRPPGRERLDACVRRVRPAAFVGVPRAHLLRLTSPAIRSIPLKMAIGGGVPGARAVLRDVAAPEAQLEPCALDTPAIITFTSGSTGEPKAAVRTHGFLAAQHRALVESLALVPGEVDLCTLPIFLLANLASGVTSVIPDADLRSPGTIDPEAGSPRRSSRPVQPAPWPRRRSSPGSWLARRREAGPASPRSGGSIRAALLFFPRCSMRSPALHRMRPSPPSTARPRRSRLRKWTIATSPRPTGWR